MAGSNEKTDADSVNLNVPLLAKLDVEFLLERSKYSLLCPDGQRERARKLIRMGLLEKDPSSRAMRTTEQGQNVVTRYQQLGWIPWGSK